MPSCHFKHDKICQQDGMQPLSAAQEMQVWEKNNSKCSPHCPAPSKKNRLISQIFVNPHFSWRSWWSGQGQDRTGQDRTKLKFKLDFPGNFWLAILTMFGFEQYKRGTVKTPHTRLFESNLLAGFNLCEAVVSKILHPRYTGEPAILSVLPPSGEYTRQEHAFNTTFNIIAINTIIINIVSSKSTWMFANLLRWYVECLSSHIYLLIHVHTWDDKKYLKRESTIKIDGENKGD